MKFNKNNSVWKGAPWHVKASVIGVSSLKGLYTYAYSGFFIGLVCFVAGVFLPVIFSTKLAFLFVAGSGLPLASCMYLFAIIWVKDNPSCCEQ